MFANVCNLLKIILLQFFPYITVDEVDCCACQATQDVFTHSKLYNSDLSVINNTIYAS